MSDAPKKPSIVPVPAATILLLRDSAEGLEVFMQQRFEGNDNFSGALLFPGGKVDAQDAVIELRDYCRTATALDDYLFTLHVAAIREAFEECGVLLARPRGEEHFVSAEHLKNLAPWRNRLNAGEASLLEILRAENLELACDKLVRFGHWTTPDAGVKRFDTHFFLAPAPHDHQLLHDGRESVDSLWITPGAALNSAQEKRHNVLFPTRCNLEKLNLSTTCDDALTTAAATTVFSVQPHIDKRADGIYLSIPVEAGYPNCEQKVSA